jgi:hypothetical protein
MMVRDRFKCATRCEPVEVGVGVQERNLLANTDRRDEAIERAANRDHFASRSSIQSRGPANVIEALESQDLEGCQPPFHAADVGLGT